MDDYLYSKLDYWQRLIQPEPRGGGHRNGSSLAVATPASRVVSLEQEINLLKAELQEAIVLVRNLIK